MCWWFDHMLCRHAHKQETLAAHQLSRVLTSLLVRCLCCSASIGFCSASIAASVQSMSTHAWLFQTQQMCDSMCSAGQLTSSGGPGGSSAVQGAEFCTGEPGLQACLVCLQAGLSCSSACQPTGGRAWGASSLHVCTAKQLSGLLWRAGSTSGLSISDALQAHCKLSRLWRPHSCPGC